MIQERNVIERSKAHPDIDRPVGSRVGEGDRGFATDIAAGLSLVLSTLAFFFSSVALIHGVRARQEVRALLSPQATVEQTRSQEKNPLVALRDRLFTPPVASRVEPGRFLKPAYGGAGEVELLSVQRASTTDSSLVNVAMRIHRLDDRVPGVGDLDLFEVVAINSRTNERYPTLNAQSPLGQTFSIYSLRPDQSVNVNVTVRVPANLNRIDLSVPQTSLFRGVPIAPATTSAPAQQ
jgi:hypothetical protein